MLPIGHRMTALLLAAGSVASAQDCYLTTTLASPPTFFTSPIAAYDTARSRILMVDQSETTPLKLYAWTGTSWTLLSANGPTPRTLAAMAYDSARDRLVLHGGLGTQPWSWYPPEVWEWDGQTWTSIPVDPGLLGRRGHAMVYDAARQKTFMFGGLYNNQLSNEVWLWDGVEWSGPNPLVRPSPRANVSLTYNTQRNTVLLVGGSANDCWEWDGQAWTQLPDPPSNGRLTFNPATGRSLFRSGTQAWDFDGTIWSFIAQFGPGALGGPNTVFDAALSRIVFAGGNGVTQWNPSGSIVPPWIITQPPAYGSYVPGVNVVLTAEVGGSSPIDYQWLKNGVNVVNGGNISGAQSLQLRFDPFTLADPGQYRLMGSNACDSIVSSTSILVASQPCSGAPCYANCDQSTGCPVLTANDFQCFLNKFAAGHSYANCDGSTGNPVLTSSDYQCFLNRYAAGCS